MSKLIARNVPVDALPLVDRFLAVRRLSEDACPAALAGRPDHPVDAGCQPDQVASRAHHAGSSRPSCCAPHAAGLSRRSIRPTTISSTPTTRRSARVIRGRSAACCRGPASRRSCAYRGHVTSAMARADRRGADGDWAAIADRARPASRAAASGADPDGHQARAVDEPAAAGLCAGARGAAAATPRRSAGSTSRAGWSRSAMPATASPSTTRGRAIAVWLDPFAPGDAAGDLRRVSAFIDDGGYRRPEFWLSDGWDCVQPARLAGAALLAAATAIAGTSSRCRACGRCAPPSRSAMSASTRPTPSPAGRASACRARPSGSSPPADVALAGNMLDDGGSIPSPAPAATGWCR